MKLLRVFKQRHPAGPAIVRAVVPPKCYYQQAMAAGADSWIQKPLELYELLDAVESSIKPLIAPTWTPRKQGPNQLPPVTR